MQTVLVLHNILRWAVLIFALWVLFSSLSGYFGKRAYTRSDDKANLFFMISMDIQLVLGLILYFNNSWYTHLKNIGGLQKAERFFALEHLVMMLIAWILVHVGRTKVKRAFSDVAKHKRALIYFGIAIVIILAAVPWPFREEIMRPWYRGFN
jgi:undecaprenyl pyrophosphate phosphatase UppP